MNVIANILRGTFCHEYNLKDHKGCNRLPVWLQKVTCMVTKGHLYGKKSHLYS